MESNEVVLAVIAVLYVAVEALKFVVMKKNGKTLTGVNTNISELKLEEERHHTKVEKLNEIREWQKDIHQDFAEMTASNAQAHQALNNGVLALQTIMGSVDEQLKKIERNTRGRG